MQDSLVVRRETHIPAPRAAVFALLTDPEKILRWMGTEAQLEPQPGGLYLVNVTGARFARGSFREVVCRERPDGAAAGRNAATSNPYRPAQRRAMRRPCGRLGPLR